VRAHAGPGRARPAQADPDVRLVHRGTGGDGDWFIAEGVTDIAMEATGAYWKPVWYVLEDRPFASCG
jgi:hypothetical protein